MTFSEKNPILSILGARRHARTDVMMFKINSLIIVEQVFILNHYHWKKIEENIHTLTPTPKTPIFGGGLDTTQDVIFGFVSTWKSKLNQLISQILDFFILYEERKKAHLEVGNKFFIQIHEGSFSTIYVRYPQLENFLSIIVLKCAIFQILIVSYRNFWAENR